jgi:hypothetical protein
MYTEMEKLGTHPHHCHVSPSSATNRHLGGQRLDQAGPRCSVIIPEAKMQKNLGIKLKEKEQKRGFSTCKGWDGEIHRGIAVMSPATI